MGNKETFKLVTCDGVGIIGTIDQLRAYMDDGYESIVPYTIRFWDDEYHISETRGKSPIPIKEMDSPYIGNVISQYLRAQNRWTGTLLIDLLYKSRVFRVLLLELVSRIEAEDSSGVDISR